MDDATDILDIISTRKAKGEPFALATVVRTVAATAAKAGAKAVILPDGTISEGWIGGGCARAAVLKAAHEALADGKPRLVSVQPPDALQDQGLTAGDERAGVRFASNLCPSRGTMDVFVEPVLPHPQIVVCGASPVAVAVAELGRRLGFAVTVCAQAADQACFAQADRRIEGYALPVVEGAVLASEASGQRGESMVRAHSASEEHQGVYARLSGLCCERAGDTRPEPGSSARGARFVVVATQGRGDEAALQAVLAVEADYVAFVGSRKKVEVLKAKLSERGIAPARLAKLKAPAGLDLGAITPDEIAVSILAEIIAVRRYSARAGHTRGPTAT